MAGMVRIMNQRTLNKMRGFKGSDRLKNNEVIDRFLDFDIGSNHNRSLRILEDTLMSYDTIIARRQDGGGIVVLNPEYAPTITTKKHINKLIRKAAVVEEFITLDLDP
jgi:hypothetical protein